MENSSDPGSHFAISHLERRWLLYFLDLITVTGGFLLSLVFREDYLFSWGLIGRHPEWLLLLTGLWFFIGHLFEIYDIEKAGWVKSAYLPVLSAGGLAMLLFNFTPYLPPTLPPSRQPLFVTIILPVGFALLGRVLYLVIFAQSRFRRRLLILGAGWAGMTIWNALLENARSQYQVVGFIDDDPEKIDQKLKTSYRDETGEEVQAAVSILGTSDDLISIVEQQGIETIILAVTRGLSGRLYQRLTDCLQREVEVIPMPLIYEQLTGKVPVEHIGDHWSVSMPLDQPGTKVAWHAVKRLFDIFWSIVGLLFLIPLFPLISIAIRLDSPGPVLYEQERLGRNGKPFVVYKFRSMMADAEANNAVWAAEKDPRVTRVGRLLRKTHLDEFPQFWNILKGEMSVVGPRPERPEFVAELTAKIPFYRVRLAAKPGMAGWGLIHQGYGASVEESLEKLRYDLYYIKHQSLWLDIYVLWKTFVDVITLGGR